MESLSYSNESLITKAEKVGTVKDCQKSCLIHDRCQAWTFHVASGECQFYSKMPISQENQEGVWSGAKSLECWPNNDCREKGVFYYGRQTYVNEVPEVDNCQQSCSFAGDCLAWTYKMGSCSLFTSNPAKMDLDDIEPTSGIMTEECKDSENASWFGCREQNVEFEIVNPTISEGAKSEERCRQACRFRSSCKTWVFVNNVCKHSTLRPTTKKIAIGAKSGFPSGGC